jgi:hypothetical protein
MTVCHPPGVLSFIVTSLPGNGSLSDPNAGVITTVPYTLADFGNRVIYTPAAGYGGTDSFLFKANDGGTQPDGGDSNQAAVTVSIGWITRQYQVSAGYDDTYESKNFRIRHHNLRVGKKARVPYYISVSIYRYFFDKAGFSMPLTICSYDSGLPAWSMA